MIKSKLPQNWAFVIHPAAEPRPGNSGELVLRCFWKGFMLACVLIQLCNLLLNEV